MSRRPPRNILTQYYFLDFSALAFAVLSLTHLAVIVVESLALDSALIFRFFCGGSGILPGGRLDTGEPIQFVLQSLHLFPDSNCPFELHTDKLANE